MPRTRASYLDGKEEASIGVPTANDAEHEAPQLRPPGVLETAPEPAPDLTTVRVAVAGSKAAWPAIGQVARR